MATALEILTQNLARLATHYDFTGQWPARSLEHLTAAGAWSWAIPKAYGGMGLDPASQMVAYEAVAAGCLSCALILTQRDGACEFIGESDNDQAKSKLLPAMATHSSFASIGISHLTTSRSGGKHALTAVRDGQHYILNGFMPWVTGAVNCNVIVTAAVEPERGQLLLWLPVPHPGLQIDPPMRLMALESSMTSEVHCRNVRLGSEHVLRPTCADALRRNSPVKSLVVAATGIGLAWALVRDMESHASTEDARLRSFAEEAMDRYLATRERVMGFAAQLNEPETDIPKSELRIAVNDLLMRLAIGAMTCGKGSGFIRQRDTQRLVREAAFFLVWSASDDVRAKTLSRFLDRPEPESKSMKI